MKCQQCGKYLPDDSIFCQYCGSDVRTQKETEKASAASSGEVGSNKRGINFKKLFIVTLCVALVLGVLCTILSIKYYPISSFTSQQNAGKLPSSFGVNELVLTTKVGKQNTLTLQSKPTQNLYAKWETGTVNAYFSAYNKLLVTTFKRGISTIKIEDLDTKESLRILVVSY